MDEIREACPDTEPVLKKVDQLEGELSAITEAVLVEQRKLPWRGVKADEERWRLATISQQAYSALDLIDPLRGCLRQLDMERLPKLLEQAYTCINNIAHIMSGAISEAAQAVK